MQYPQFFEMYKAGIRNTWTVDEVDLKADVHQLHQMTEAERHLVQRLVAFFATGDSIVANNLVLNLYQHINSPEARMYLSRQLFEEALHVQFYLALLDTYIPEAKDREEAFAAVEKIPSIKQKAEFCYKYMDTIHNLITIKTTQDKKQFLINLICFASCIEGLFFFGAFAYIYFLRSKGLLHGLATGTNWVFRDESCHMAFGFEVIKVIRKEEPDLFDQNLTDQVNQMLKDAIDCEMAFCRDALQFGVVGLSEHQMWQYLRYCADSRLASLEMPLLYGDSNPFGFMELQDVQELTNFFERRVAAYQTGITGEFATDEDF